MFTKISKEPKNLYPYTSKIAIHPVVRNTPKIIRVMPPINFVILKNFSDNFGIIALFV